MSGWIPEEYGREEVDEDCDELKIVLVGKTGVGKSSSGNTILGEEVFKADLSPSTVTEKCQKATRRIRGRNVTVIDTPGLFDTEIPPDKLKEEIVRSISMMAPGPHVFLVVMPLGRVTQEEIETVELIKEMFGEKASSHTMVLFTRADDLRGKSLDDYFAGNKKGSAQLREILQSYGQNYHAFNNATNDGTQVTQLLKKIDTIVAKNGRRCYTSAMLQEAERAVKKEEEETLKKIQQDIRKQMEDLRKFYEGNELERRIVQICREERRKARAQAETDNQFIRCMLINLATTIVNPGANVDREVACVAVRQFDGTDTGAGGRTVIYAATQVINKTSPRCCVQ